MNKNSTHWENVYQTKGEIAVSWFQEKSQPSLELIKRFAVSQDSAIIDIGGGASRLFDDLLADRFHNLSVLDLSASAIEISKARIGKGGERVRWIVGDATIWSPSDTYDVWHDRAAFHFLITSSDQAAYIERLKRSLNIGGYVIFGTFALDGPEKCSGLLVMRYSSETLQALLGNLFSLVDSRRHEHRTPLQSVQKFQFNTFRHIS